MIEIIALFLKCHNLCTDNCYNNSRYTVKKENNRIH